MVIVTIIPLKGCQKYGYVVLYQSGSNGEVLVKYGIIDFWTNESTINQESLMANLNKIKISDIYLSTM